LNLEDYGFNPNMLPSNTSAIPARVTAVYKERYELVCIYGQIYGRLKAAEYYNGNELFPTTGDFVLIDYIPNGDSRIIKTLKRKSYFSRLDPSSCGYAEQSIAANFDYVFIIQSLNHDFNLHRLERYLTLAWQSGAVPVIVLTKADLCENYTEYINAAERIAFGVNVYVVSAKTGYGLETLSKYLQPNKTIVFLGSSGVGKSSLVNALFGEEIMAVNEIREDDSRGRHTTTHRQLIKLNNGVMIIDTPGLRELGMWDVSQGLEQSFADVEKFLGKCKFNDCRHINEPGCAIKLALENGELSAERWNSYQKLKHEAKYSDDKEEFLREKEKFFKSIAKSRKDIKKHG
jgi:ribosome biogenesis GTPase